MGEIQCTKDSFSLNPDSIKIYPDITWIEDKTLLGNISNQLINIKNILRNNNHYYIDYRTGKTRCLNPNFKHENSYENLRYIDAGYRLLSLFRYWNIIQYHYPNKHLIGESWNDILPEFIPKFIYATTENEYKLILAKLIARINDTHASVSFIYHLKGDNIIPVEINFVENKAMVTKLYKVDDNKKRRLQVGDIILKIDNNSIEHIIRQDIPITSASNYPTLLRDISFNLLRTDYEKIFIEFDRSGKLMADTFSCFPINQVEFSFSFQQDRPLFEMLQPYDILYLYLGSATDGTIPDSITAKDMIIDLRCYPSSQSVKGYWNFYQLYPHPVEFAKFMYGSTVMPGLFTFSEPVKVGVENANYYKGKKNPSCQRIYSKSCGIYGHEIPVCS